MARTLVPVTVPNKQYPALPLTAGSAALPFQAADTVNLNNCVSTGRELLIVQSTDAGAQTVTINSAPDERGRTGDITAYSIPAGAFAVFGPFPTPGWKQSDGTLWFQASAVTLKFAVIQLPPVQ